MQSHEFEAYEISTDRSRLDREMIHQFLRTCYWAKNIPRQTVDKSLDHSLCFGAYHENRQVGFGRVVTDYATFGYLADVFVLPEHRGRGVGKRLVRAVVTHPDLGGLRRLLLATNDAHGLYIQFGFQPIATPEHYLTIHRPNLYNPPPVT